MSPTSYSRSSGNAIESTPLEPDKYTSTSSTCRRFLGLQHYWLQGRIVQFSYLYRIAIFAIFAIIRLRIGLNLTRVHDSHTKTFHQHFLVITDRFRIAQKQRQVGYRRIQFRRRFYSSQFIKESAHWHFYRSFNTGQTERRFLSGAML